MGTVANTALTVHQQTAQNSINTGLSRAQNDASVGNMGYMRDSNKQFADWAARGDYGNERVRARPDFAGTGHAG